MTSEPQLTDFKSFVGLSCRPDPLPRSLGGVVSPVSKEYHQGPRQFNSAWNVQYIRRTTRRYYTWGTDKYNQSWATWQSTYKIMCPFTASRE